MIITKLSGGLGNQMFQYAAARALSIKWQEKLLFDTSLFSNQYPNVDKRAYALDIFKNIKPRFSRSFLSGGFYMHSRWDNRIRKILGARTRKVLREEAHSFNPFFNEITAPVLLEGYWQTEKYFKPFENIIRKDFEFPGFEQSDKNNSILNDILMNESVSVHVRRGDYVNYGTENKFYGVCDKEYFQNAIQYFLSIKNDLKFYFFSEDAAWIQSHLISDAFSATIVTGNYGQESWKDMYLMSNCKYHIIANSSFSWWGAWLSTSASKRVVSPSKWFKTDDPFYEPNDVVPGSWVRM
ncbi:MAG TPA: alpha-1,2-fucosyltransferase [Puia sp.]|nr:alpha-1,2-fucosyltransferase [Puia sp.]